MFHLTRLVYKKNYRSVLLSNNDVVLIFVVIIHKRAEYTFSQIGHSDRIKNRLIARKKIYQNNTNILSICGSVYIMSSQL